MKQFVTLAFGLSLLTGMTVLADVSGAHGSQVGVKPVKPAANPAPKGNTKPSTPPPAQGPAGMPKAPSSSTNKTTPANQNQGKQAPGKAHSQEKPVVKPNTKS